MKNGPELWDKILSHFPEGSIIAGGAIRDYFLAVEPKDYDVFVPEQLHFAAGKPDFGLSYLDTDTDEKLKDHHEEYTAVRNIKTVLRGEIEGVTVDAIVITMDDPVKIIEDFDFGLTQLFYGGGVLYKKAAFNTDFENDTMTLLRGDRFERAQRRFDRFNAKNNGRFKLVITPEAQKQIDEAPQWADPAVVFMPPMAV